MTGNRQYIAEHNAAQSKGNVRGYKLERSCVCAHASALAAAAAAC